MASYGTVAGVAALVPHSVAVNQTLHPTDAQVTTWLAEGYARINRVVASAGYSVPVDAVAAVYGELTALNNLYAAAYALRSRGIDTMNGEEESRSEVWLKAFDDQMKEIAGSNLAAVGATIATGETVAGAPSRRRVRTLQMRRVDGYSGAYEGDTTEYPNVSE